MKKIYFLIIVSIFTVSLSAQVTIGSLDAPAPGAILELKSNQQSNSYGFLPPRIELSRPSSPAPLTSHVQGMVVFNTNNAPADTLQAGLYYNTGEKWIRLATNPPFAENWFYMPSFPIKTSVSGTFQVNLWQEYTRQFDNTTAGSMIASSDGTIPKPLSKVYAAEELNYYVIGYDNTVFSNVSLTTAGLLNYTISPAGVTNASDSTYMNIVFVAK